MRRAGGLRSGGRLGVDNRNADLAQLGLLLQGQGYEGRHAFRVAFLAALDGVVRDLQDARGERLRGIVDYMELLGTLLEQHRAGQPILPLARGSRSERTN